MRIDLGTEPPTLDPTMAQDAPSISVLGGITRPLMYFDKDLKTVPSLAETADVSADAKTITFTLRDAQYSNGDTIVAGDLATRGSACSIPPRRAVLLRHGAGGGRERPPRARRQGRPDRCRATAAMDKLGVSAPDDKTFIVTLESPPPTS
jgi:oligopeptide transport system substrate-binding protein